MDKRIFYMAHAEARRRALEAVQNAPEGYKVTIEPPKRTHAQNDALWALLGEIASTRKWYGQTLTAGEWKDMFTAALKRQKVVPGLDGGFVVIGASTSNMTKEECSDLITSIEAWACENEPLTPA